MKGSVVFDCSALGELLGVSLKKGGLKVSPELALGEAVRFFKDPRGSLLGASDAVLLGFADELLLGAIVGRKLGFPLGESRGILE